MVNLSYNYFTYNIRIEDIFKREVCLKLFFRFIKIPLRKHMKLDTYFLSMFKNKYSKSLR